MPRVEFTLWDRVYILKLICTVQMTYSSFITMLYIYLIILQGWTSLEGERTETIRDKWTVIAITVVDFGSGTLLAFAANMRGIRCRRRIVTWILLETILIPISIFFLMQLHHKITTAKERYQTDPHYSRLNLAQVCFLICDFFFIAYAIDFLATYKETAKTYDPTIRPESVYAPTDPQITTTESRHIRMSQSFFAQPSTSKGVPKNAAPTDSDEAPGNGNSHDSDEVQ